MSNIVKYNQSIVKMDNKPKMAIALENKKIRDYPELERNKETATLIKYLLNLLAVNDKGAGDHHAACFKFINDNYKSYTYEEIRLAFGSYVAHEYFDGKVVLRPYQQLNTPVIGKVMFAYNNARKQELNEYYRLKAEQEKVSKELTQEQKDKEIKAGILSCWENFKKTLSIATWPT